MQLTVKPYNQLQQPWFVEETQLGFFTDSTVGTASQPVTALQGHSKTGCHWESVQKIGCGSTVYRA